MTKDQLINDLTMIESQLADAAEVIGEVMAFADPMKDEGDDKIWGAYDTIRFQAAQLRLTVRRIQEQV